MGIRRLHDLHQGVDGGVRVGCVGFSHYSVAGRGKENPGTNGGKIMDSIDKAVVAILTIIAVGITTMVVTNTIKAWETDQYAMELGYSEVQNVGAIGSHWVKEAR